MLHSRGELLLMLDADGATQVTDLAKLEAQVCHKLNQIASWKKKLHQIAWRWAGFDYDEHNILRFAFLLLGSCTGGESWLQSCTLC
jgi:hypothetical protein